MEVTFEICDYTKLIHLISKNKELNEEFGVFDYFSLFNQTKLKSVIGVVSFIDDKPIGYIYGYKQSCDTNKLYISEIYISIKYRRLGIAKKMLQIFEDHATFLGYNSLELISSCNENIHQHLYINSNFKRNNETQMFEKKVQIGNK